MIKNPYRTTEGNDMKLDDKVIYITGGSSGIGLEIARQVFSMGAHVLLVARDPKKLEEAKRDVDKNRRNQNQKIKTMSMDVQDEAITREKLRSAVEEFGAPDILITSAGIGAADYFENITYDTFDATIKTNVYGTRNVIAALLPSMKQKGGAIAIISSIAGLLGMFGYTAYGTSKFALMGFAECLRSELKRYGIRVSVVCPPETDTPLIYAEAKTIPPEARALKNLAGFLKPDYVARYIIKGIANKRYLIIPGFMARALYYTQCYLPGWIVRLSADLTAARAAKISKRMK
jgi:3-dehydrosphinganine reductase